MCPHQSQILPIGRQQLPVPSTPCGRGRGRVVVVEYHGGAGERGGEAVDVATGRGGGRRGGLDGAGAVVVFEKRIRAVG